MANILECLNKRILCKIKNSNFKNSPMETYIREFSENKLYAKLNSDDWVKVDDIEFLDFMKKEPKLTQAARTTLNDYGDNETENNSSPFGVRMERNEELDEAFGNLIEERIEDQPWFEGERTEMRPVSRAVNSVDKKEFNEVEINEENLGDEILFVRGRVGSRLNNHRIVEGTIQRFSSNKKFIKIDNRWMKIKEVTFLDILKRKEEKKKKNKLDWMNDQ